MPNHDSRRGPPLARWAGALTLGLTLFAGELRAAPQPVGPDRAVPAAKAEVQSIRLAGVGGAGIGLYGRPPGPDYCSQPGFCYPAPRVVHEKLGAPRRIKRAAAAKPKRRGTRTAKASAPKPRLVRSIAATAAPGTNVGAPFSVGPGSRSVGTLVGGDSTGGGRATPTFRGPSGGGGPVTVGDTSGGGRTTPTFRTVPSGGGPTLRGGSGGLSRR